MFFMMESYVLIVAAFAFTFVEMSGLAFFTTMFLPCTLKVRVLFPDVSCENQAAFPAAWMGPVYIAIDNRGTMILRSRS
jgi:hypothetical protein